MITIDGPSGAGKGTVCVKLARSLGWQLLDSGAIYRVVALGALNHGIKASEVDKLVAYAKVLDVTFPVQSHSDLVGVVLEGQDVSAEIRSESCGNMASQVAAIPQLREALLDRQRDFRQAPGLVADGRDMGTVVFPDAEVKIFLTASAEERAQRRYKQLKDKGISANLPDLLTEIAERDDRDAQRSVSPLKPAADAVVLDTTSLTISEVRDKVLDLCRERFEQVRQ